jgi:hypothetical protein
MLFHPAKPWAGVENILALALSIEIRRANLRTSAITIHAATSDKLRTQNYSMAYCIQKINASKSMVQARHGAEV